MTLTFEQLKDAIQHLVRSREILAQAGDEIVDGIIMIPYSSENLEDAWFEINKCREYTETCTDLEEFLQPAMGLINDARCMVLSIAADFRYMTRASRTNIYLAMQQASSLAFTAQELLEILLSSFMTMDRKEGQLAKEGSDMPGVFQPPDVKVSVGR